MSFDPYLAEFRFGYGLSPAHPGPASAKEMVQRLAGPDVAAERFALPRFSQILERMKALDTVRADLRATTTKQDTDRSLKARRHLLNGIRRDQMVWLGTTLARRSWTRDAFRERLVAFWADHFTARGKGGVAPWAMTPHVESAIRPHVTGRFADLLKSAIKAPLMLEFLDQRSSRGPGSLAAQRMGGNAGLNENLARELLELHTLGVDAAYSQTDVRQLAELLTGLTFHPTVGTRFNTSYAEPGAETVLGRQYGGDAPSMADIDAILDMLATHPATAAHIGRKLAVHFLADSPDPGLASALEARFIETDGDLMALYETLLSHPAAWDPAPSNLRPPLDWVSAVIRALAVDDRRLSPAANESFFAGLPGALARMGQPYEHPAGPDGWPEEDAFWITPQGIAARLQWALAVPRLLGPVLPDPRDFVETALGPRANDRLRFAAAAAESRSDGIGLVLAAPEFQRS